MIAGVRARSRRAPYTDRHDPAARRRRPVRPCAERVAHPRALADALDAFARAAADRPALLGPAPRALAGSPWLAEQCVRREARIGALAAAGALDADADLAARDAALEADLARRAARLPADGPTPDAELALLREFRHVEQWRLVWHAVVHEPPLETTFRALTALAEACVRVAWTLASARTARRHGLVRGADGAPLAPVIVAMGKLGGGELNVSSDIDLIALHPPGTDSDGARPLSAGEWYARAVRETVRLLSARTVDGICFRVDTRLRPFGESGPPVTSLPALERYWREHGRDWERYAMIKARALTGSEASIAAFETMRRAFVYRRYPDYAAIASLRELKAMIVTAAAGRAARRRPGASGPGSGRFAGDDDVKLGRGGIREVEFVAQAHQLVRGGSEPALRGRSLVPVLRELGRLGHVPVDDARALERSYRGLRRVENALQAMRDEQTHALPRDPEDRSRLALLLGAPDIDAALGELDAHRAAVAARFDALFGGEGIGADPPGGDGSGAVAGRDAGIDAHGAGTPGAAADAPLLAHPALAALREGPARRRLPERSARRLDALLPKVVEAVGALDAELAPVALGRAADFLAAAAGRGGYLQVLLDRPATLARLVGLFAASAWAAREASSHPVLIETLLADRADAPADGVADGAGADVDVWRTAAARALDGVAADDLEAGMSALRRFRRAASFSIAVDRIEGRLDVMRASDASTRLAEAVVERVLERVAAPLLVRHGVPTVRAADGGARPVALAVIAYGKLGGRELSPDSDLDLVFLHDAPADGGGESDGPEPIANALWHARLVRRFTHFMTVATEAGALYEVDLRLRPNGSAGMLVTSLDAFAGYQRESAWTWEHQALLRARAVAGDPALRARFEALRAEILCRVREPVQLARDVADMRARMLEALGTSPPGRMHIKRDPGGLTDLEFVVQHLALAHAAAHPRIVRHSDNVRVIEAARDAGVLAPADAAALIDAWLALRERALDATLALEGPEVDLDPALAALAGRVRELRAGTLGPLA